MEQVNAWIDAINEVPQFREMLGDLGATDQGIETVLAAMRTSLRGAVVHGCGVGLKKATMVAITRRTVHEVRGARYLPKLPGPRIRRTGAG
jgi:hypothetical protein